MKKIYLPKSLRYINIDAFNGCDNLETVFYRGNEEEWGNVKIGNRNDALIGAELVCNAVENTKTVIVKGSDGENIFITTPYYLPENVEIILALMQNRRLVELKSALNKNETIYFVVSKEFDSAKIMVWESFDNLKPICSEEIIK